MDEDYKYFLVSTVSPQPDDTKYFAYRSDTSELDDVEKDKEPTDYTVEKPLSMVDLTDSENSSDTQYEEQPQCAEEWIDRHEILRMESLRKYILELDENLRQCQFVVDKTREELKKSEEMISQLESEKNEVSAEIEEAESINKVSALHRLRAQHRRICMELEEEKELKRKIENNLEKTEYNLAIADLKKGKFLVAEDELIHKDQQLRQQKCEEAAIKVKNEKQFAWRARHALEANQRCETEAVKEMERKHTEAIQEAKKLKEKHTKYLKTTLAKLQQREEEVKKNYESEMQRKIEMLLKLKSDIDTNKNYLKTIHGKLRAKAEMEKEEEKEERKKIISEGGNADMLMLIKQRKLEQEKQIREFEMKQEQRHVELIKKILKEEAIMKKKVNLLKPCKCGDVKEKEGTYNLLTKPKHLQRMMESLEKNNLDKTANHFEASNTVDHLPVEDYFKKDDKETENLCPHLSQSEMDTEDDDENNANLVKPEFDGLWDQHKPYKAPTERSSLTVTHHFSKMEKEIQKRQLETQRMKIVSKQVVAGREFKGCAFYSKPDVIYFKNFDVGKTYKKKVVLTNVSYSINALKLIGITERLKDFIQLEFNPPGQMSAGLTCNMLVTFSPMINEDLSGEVNFLSQTGHFSIPLICSTKKCDLSVDTEKVSFGSTVIGEILKKTIILKNKGALGTKYNFYKISPGISMLADTTVPEGTQVEMEDTERNALEEMKVGTTASGMIQPFSSVKLELICQPQIPGLIRKNFKIAFSDPLPETGSILVKASAEAVDVPVWVKDKVIDLKICMLDRLYQYTLVINNRAKSALKLTFEVCKELRNYIELLPKTGYIQAQAQFSAQLKFVPRKTLPHEAGDYFDKETGILEVPMTILVADQTRPVNFTVSAIVTTSDLEFDVKDLDFGYCTIYESTIIPIKLTNKSILPQQYGFLELPDYVDVQPNDGFGTILPLQTIELHVIFQPKKADIYNFHLVCWTLINRSFKVQCKGVGVHPPLELSHQIVKFAGTALSDVSTTCIYVKNTHTTMHTHGGPISRIGKGEISPVGPTSFEFVVPGNIPLTISPCVGTVEPGKKCKIQIRFSPVLEEEEIKQEAVMMIVRVQEAKDEAIYQEALMKYETEQQELAQKAAALESLPKSKRKNTPQAKTGKSATARGSVVLAPSRAEPVLPPDPNSILKDSKDFTAAAVSLLRKYPGKFTAYTIPCFIASGQCKNAETLQYSIHNTVYLEVHCPVIQPPVVLISNNGNTTFDFGDVFLGQCISKSVTLQNISDETVILKASALDTNEYLSIRNALRPMRPGEIHNLQISFTPTEKKIFHEVLELHSQRATLHIILTGRGVSPKTSLSFKGEVFDMGTILAGEFCEKMFVINNLSDYDVDFTIRLDSLSYDRYTKAQSLPAFISDKTKTFLGPQNYNGLSPFDIIPSQGTISAGMKKDITVAFCPDHASDNYSDGVNIQILNKEKAYFFQLQGSAKVYNVFIEGFDTIITEGDSLALEPAVSLEEDIKAPVLPTTVLLNMCSVLQGNEFVAAKRELYFGCVPTMAVGQKKGGEFIFENTQQLTAKGFSIEPIKSTIESGSKKAAVFTWIPPAGYDANQPMTASILVTLKGSVVQHYRVAIKAFIVCE